MKKNKQKKDKKNTAICFYFEVHQPRRLLKNYTYFDIGHNHFYEDSEANEGITQKVATKCYLPTNKLLLELIERFEGKFKIAFSITGTAIEQFKLYSPETLQSFKTLVDSGCVELLNETYYHSLSSVFSKDEFKEQIKLHAKLMQEEFGVTPTAFRNTELIYNNDLAKIVDEMGYKVMLTEGVDRILDWRSPNFLYTPVGCENLKLLLKNYRLSDDIAFRFSTHTWNEFPLTADKFAGWLHAQHENAQIINLFMDYETFGEHQWEETGIFKFLDKLPEFILQHPNFSFVTPTEASEQLTAVGTYDTSDYISWADIERDLSAWKSNALQDDALHALYALEKSVKQTKSNDLVDTWRHLQTSDHFYYMCTKFNNDGSIHNYFNHYANPYEAYINYQNILSDFEEQVEDALKKITLEKKL
jgi:alpha-amylase